MRTTLFILFTLTLSACGGEDKQVDTALASSTLPNFNVPADALITDYVCTDKIVYRVNGGPEQIDSSNDEGTMRSWSNQDKSIQYSLDELSNGKEKTFYQSKAEKLSDTLTKRTSNYQYWTLTDGNWSKRDAVKEFIRQKQADGTSLVVSYKLDGVEKPYYWKSEIQYISDKSDRSIQTHTNPSAMNKNGITFTSYVITCVNTDR